MINIPMKSQGPMQTAELRRINRAKGAQKLQGLDQNSLLSGRDAAPAPNQSRPVPGRGAAPGPNQGGRPVSGREAAAVPGRAAALPNQGAQPAPPQRPAPGCRHPPATGMALQKGQKISLSQLDPGLEQIEAGLGWELGPNARGYELDAEAFLLGASGKVIGDDWFVFYNQPASPDRAVRLVEPEGSGSAPRDDAVMQVDLRRLDPGVTRIVLILTIDEARERGYNFGSVANAYVRILNRATRRELVRFRLTDYYSNVCSMMVGEIYRYKDEWRFNPVGNGTGDDLAGLCVRYGVSV